MKHYTVYKTTNTVNGKIYVGKHVTEDPDDDYIGSGKHLWNAINKYGKDKFFKKVLYDFDNEDEMNSIEAEIVNEEFVERSDTYNLTTGGSGSWHHIKGTVAVRDREGNMMQVSQDDERIKEGLLLHINSGMTTAKDSTGNTMYVSADDSRFASGELVGVVAGTVTVKDHDGNIMQVSVNDSRYISGELVPIWKGCHHSDETKKKLVESHRKHGHQRGVKNSQYGTKWVSNFKTKKSLRVKKSEIKKYLAQGYQLGACFDFSKYDDIGQRIPKKPEELERDLMLKQEMKNRRRKARRLKIASKFMPFWLRRQNGESLKSISEEYVDGSYSSLASKLSNYEPEILELLGY